jgi:hypothetical protein
MVNAGATRFRGRRVALPAGRSVSAVLASDDGNVRAYLVAMPGRLEYVVLEAACGGQALSFGIRDARAAEDRSAKSNAVNKSAKVVLERGLISTSRPRCRLHAGAAHAGCINHLHRAVVSGGRSVVRSLRLGRFYQLLDDVKFDLCKSASNHPQRLSRRIRDVDNASGNERTAVIDPNRHGPPCSDVCHAQPGAEWQRAMSRGQFVRIELFTVRGLCSFRVEAGKPGRRNLCLGRLFVRRERGMFFRDRHTPVRHE